MSSLWGLRDYGTNANQIYFDVDPYTSPIPEEEKKIIKCSSAPSWEDDGTIIPSIDSFFNPPISERGGRHTIEHDYMKLSTVRLFHAKKRSSTHQIYTRYFNGNVKEEYRVIVADFKPSDRPIGVTENNEEVYSFRLDLINIQKLI